MRVCEQIYDLLSLGKALEQVVEMDGGPSGDAQPYHREEEFHADWRKPSNNVFHVVEEFEVERSGSKELCRPDIVLFVNGDSAGGASHGPKFHALMQRVMPDWEGRKERLELMAAETSVCTIPESPPRDRRS